MPAAENEKEVDSIIKNEIAKNPVNIPVEKLHEYEVSIQNTIILFYLQS